MSFFRLTLIALLGACNLNACGGGDGGGNGGGNGGRAAAGYEDPVRLVDVAPLGKFDGLRPITANGSVRADFNADGHEDLLVTLSTTFQEPGGVQVQPLLLLNDGAGSLVDSTAEMIADPIPRFALVRDLHVEDFNGDGRADVFFSNHGFEYPLDGDLFPCEQNRLLLSNADGRLHDRTIDSLPALVDFSHGSSTADIDRDGDIDIWVNNLGCSERIESYLLENDGSGKFTIVADLGGPRPGVGRGDRIPAGFQAYWTHFIDADGDGDADLYAANGSQMLLVNDGSGRFSFAPDPMPDFFLPDLLDSAAVDLDGNGFIDLVLLQHSQDEPTRFGVQLLMSNGDGTFRDDTRSRLPLQGDGFPGVGGPLGSLRLAHLNGDDAWDIKFVLFGPDDFSPESHVRNLYLNNGAGFFEALPRDFAPIRNGLATVGPGSQPVDVNGDGFDDFVSFQFRSDVAEAFITRAVADR